MNIQVIKNENILKHNQEIIGNLEKISDLKTHIKLIFSIEKTIIIPFESKLFDKIQKQKDNKIGIINLDGKYRVRKMRKTVKLPLTIDEIKQINNTKYRKPSKYVNKKDNKNYSNIQIEHEKIVEKIDKLLNLKENKIKY